MFRMRRTVNKEKVLRVLFYPPLPGEMPLPHFIILHEHEQIMMLERPGWEEAWECLGIS